MQFFTFVHTRADVAFDDNSDSGVDDIRRLESGTSQPSAHARTRQRVYLFNVTFTFQPHSISN